MDKELIFATNNQHKLKEIKEILKSRFEVIGLNEAGFYDDIVEDGSTLEENASIKSKTIHKLFNADVFADDTGLEVEALDNAPGVYSARFAGPENNSDANIDKLLKLLDGKENRKARFRTVISLIINNKEHQFEGIVDGRIDTKRNGKSGFGYDPIFIPDGFKISFAEMSAEEKNSISHRGRAMEKLIKFLNEV